MRKGRVMNKTHTYSERTKNVKNTFLGVGVATIVGLVATPAIATYAASPKPTDPQMGGAPGAAANLSDSDQLKNEAIAVVKSVYDYTPPADGDPVAALNANRQAHLSDAFYTRYSADRTVLKYDSILHSQSGADMTTYGPAFLDGKDAYVPVDRYIDTGAGQTKLNSLVVVVDTSTSKITGVAGIYE